MRSCFDDNFSFIFVLSRFSVLVSVLVEALFPVRVFVEKLSERERDVPTLENIQVVRHRNNYTRWRQRNWLF